MLIERDAELAEVDRAIADASRREGRVLVFEGPAGIGKTTLLDKARERARHAGHQTLGARGGELEGAFPYSLVRQLLEPTVRAAAPSEREGMLAGAAGLATPAVLDIEPGGPPTAEREFAVLHGLYWLVANLSERSPVVLIVDDLHWSDLPSLRFFVYLARRLDGLAATLIASVRSDELVAGSVFIAQLKQTPGARIAAPAALSDTAVASVLTAEFDQQVGVAFASACRNATGGNPFLVRALAAALIADGIAPTSAATGKLASVGPGAVAHATLTRLGRLSADAIEFAQAIAVLGSDARWPLAARLAGLSEPAALMARDALVAANVLADGGALEFNHPIVRTAIYNDLSTGSRSVAHLRSADLLTAEGAAIDQIAGHLLLSEPSRSTQTIATLREAASHALALGAPGNAVAYLSRALDEGSERDLRANVLLELATAEQIARDPAAIAHFDEVRRFASDPVVRARAMIGQAHTLAYLGDWQAASDLVDATFQELGGRDTALAAAAEALRAALCAYDPRLIDAFEKRLPALRLLAAGDSGRTLALLLACVDASRGARQDHVVTLVEYGWENGHYLTYGADEMLGQAITALVFCEHLDRADEIVETIRAASTTTGSVMRVLVADAHSAWIEARRGQLVTAAATMRDVFERATEAGLQFAVMVTLWYCADALLERPELADLATLAEQLELGPLAEVAAGAQILQVRGRLRFANGETAAAIADLRRAGEICSALSFADPAGFGSWRSVLAGMLGPKHHQEALTLVTEELADARRIGRPRGVGIALRALGTLEGSDVGRAHLEEAVSVLSRSPARLEHARTLIELGAMLRRQGNRSAARGPLRQGMDLAAHCGATVLTARAQTELAASGARPRRQHVTGRDALTPSEQRVAQLASEGRTNQEIAQALFVTTKTIDSHLQHTYTKLGINSRKQLGTALGLEAAKSS
jgi:DNA-binding CsgD family transcriptional regulator